MITPSSRSPPRTLTGVPVLAALLDPWFVAVTSRELEDKTPVYSRMAKRSVLFEMLSATVTVFAPPEMFSA